MSLLKTKAEDLVASKTSDARKIAKSTLQYDVDDIISDPERSQTDDEAQNAIDTAVSTGSVHQEAASEEILNKYKQLKKMKTSDLRAKWKLSRGVGDASGLDKEGLISDILRDEYGKKRVDKAFNIEDSVHQETDEEIMQDLANSLDVSVDELVSYAYQSVGYPIDEKKKKMKGEDPCWDDYEMIGHKKKNGKKVPNCVPKEDVNEASFNKKAFFNKAEQEAFAHYMANSKMVDPMTGFRIMTDSDFMYWVSEMGSFIDVKNRLSEIAIEKNYIKNKNYMKELSSAMKKAETLESDSPEVLMWRTLTSYLQPVI